MLKTQQMWYIFDTRNKLDSRAYSAERIRISLKRKKKKKKLILGIQQQRREKQILES